MHYYVGALSPAVSWKHTKVVEPPDGPKIIAATFVDNQRVLVAARSGRGNVLRVWQIGSRAKREAARGEPRITGNMTSLVADRSGLHVLAVVDGRLLWWNHGETAVHKVADQIAATWLGG